MCAASGQRRSLAGVRQVSILSVGRVVAAGISAIWFVIAARHMSVDAFGSLALLLSIGLSTAFLTDLGLSGVLADLVSHRPTTARAAARRVIRRRLPLAALASLVTLVAYTAAGGEGGWSVAIIFAPSLVATAVYGTFTAAFRSLGAVRFEAWNEVLSRIVVLVFGTLVVTRSLGIAAVVSVYVLADVASALVLGVLFLRKTEHARDPADEERISLRAARTLGVTGIVNTIYFRIDLWLVALFKNEATVGRYAVAYRLFEGVLLPATAVAALSIPQTGGMTGNALRRELRHLVWKSLLVTAPLALVCVIFAPEIITLLFGAKYLQAVPSLRLLSVGALCTAVTAVVLPPLAIRSSKTAVVMLTALAANVTANLLAIPRFGANGAAAATLLCEVCLMAWALAAIFRPSELTSHHPFENPDRIVEEIGLPFELEKQ
jgi:O-antigen/teichoic acid export membrane protein